MFARIWVIFVWWYIASLTMFYITSHYVSIKSDKILFGVPVMISAILTVLTFL